MEFYRYKMSKFLKSRIFEPCRGKVPVLLRLSEAIAEMTFSLENHDDFDLVVVIGKFQRIFFISDKKIFSLNFPFSVQRSLEKTEPNIFTSSGVLIDSYLLSRLTTVLTDNLTEIERDIYWFAESVISSFTTSSVDGVPTASDDVWVVLKRLLLIEDGYLRYDYDPIHFHAETHPLDHLDIFYSPECTFKVGLEATITHELLVDILDPKTRCRIMNI